MFHAHVKLRAADLTHGEQKISKNLKHNLLTTKW